MRGLRNHFDETGFAFLYMLESDRGFGPLEVQFMIVDLQSPLFKDAGYLQHNY